MNENMHPAKRNLIMGLLLIVGGLVLNAFLFSSDFDFDRTSRKLAKLKQPVPLAEYSVAPQGPVDFVFVDQFEPLGEQVEFTNDFTTISYLPVRAEAKQAGGEVRPDVFLLSCASDTDINHFIAEGTFKGVLIQPSEKKQNLSDNEKAIQAKYPDLDPRDAAILWVHTPPKGQRIGALFAFGLPAIGMAFMIWWYCREMRQDRKWRERAEAFQPSDLDAFPKAVRLVHADCSPLLNSLTPRFTDPSYDVPSQPQQAYAKARVIGWSFVSALVSVGVVVAIQLLLSNLGFRWNQGVASVIGFSAVFSLAQFLLHRKINSTNKLRAESPVEEKKARYRQTAFHKYHDNVLRKLGFSDLGDYQLVTASTPGLVRTIYLSSQGNTLVEIGSCFFTIKTLTNDGKFLETHSQVSKHQEKRDSNARHLRHSAKHENILQALEEHDDLVAERNYGGSVLEAQFTAERFGRFLAWADRKTSEPVSIARSHQPRAASQLKSAIRV